MRPAPQAIVWDMGGIIYRYFTEMMIDVGEERGWPLDRIPLGPTGPLHDDAYQRLLREDLDEPEYLDIVKERLSVEGIEYDPPRDLDWKGQTRPVTMRAIEAFGKRGLAQAILTNDASRWLGEGWWETWEFSDWFQAMIDVKTLGVRKPAPEPYRAAAAAVDLPPEACLFVDDLPVNCRGAEDVGMTSHLFRITDPERSIDALAARLSEWRET